VSSDSTRDTTGTRGFWDGKAREVSAGGGTTDNVADVDTRALASHPIAIWEDSYFESGGGEVCERRDLVLALIDHIELFDYLGEYLSTRLLSPPLPLSVNAPSATRFKLGFFCGTSRLLFSAVNFHDLLFDPRHQLELSLFPLEFDPRRFNCHLRALEQWVQKVIARKSLIMQNSDEIRKTTST